MKTLRILACMMLWTLFVGPAFCADVSPTVDGVAEYFYNGAYGVQTGRNDTYLSQWPAGEGWGRYRGFIYFPVGDVPPAQLSLTVEVILLSYDDADDPNYTISSMESGPTENVGLTVDYKWADCADGTIYYQGTAFTSSGTHTIALNQNAVYDYTAAMSSGKEWFGLGIKRDREADAPNVGL